MITEQQRKSRRGLERSARSVERYGLKVLVIEPAAEKPSHAFEIQVLNADGATWSCLPDGANRAEDLKARAEKIARSPNKPAVRVIRPLGSRAVYCFNFKKR